IAALPKTGNTIELDGKATNVPVAQVARDAGINLHWSPNSDSLNWTLGDAYFNTGINQRFSFLEGTPDSIPAMDTLGLKIGLNLSTDRPKGNLAFKGARIITMNNDEVIENGTIIINGNTIMALGSSDAVNIPADAKILDVSGKTIMPGLVDVHAHLSHFRFGLSAQKHWPYYANLAYGVTTTHDPSANTEVVFSQSEMVR